MNILNLITNSSIGKRLFAEDLADRASDRKKWVTELSSLKKRLTELQNKNLIKLDADIKSAEAQLATLREKRQALIIQDNQARESLIKQIKTAELELKRQAPACLIAAQSAIRQKLGGKSFVYQDQVNLANDLLNEIGSLLYCLDDAQILQRAVEIEAAAAKL